MKRSKKDSSIKKAKISNFFTIFKYMRPYIGVYLVGWVFLILSSLAGLFFPYLLGKLLGSSNASLNNQESFSLLSVETINDITIALFILFAFQAIFSFFRIVLFTNVTENALRDIRNFAFKSLTLNKKNIYKYIKKNLC